LEEDFIVVLQMFIEKENVKIIFPINISSFLILSAKRMHTRLRCTEKVGRHVITKAIKGNFALIGQV